jgi:hypothetical protein
MNSVSFRGYNSPVLGERRAGVLKQIIAAEHFVHRATARQGKEESYG